MTENTLEKLAQLLEQDQFELIFSESGAGRGQDIRLVYLMNDAVESFLVFRDARMTGEYHAEYEGELEASLNKQGEEFVLVVKQGKTCFRICDWKDLYRKTEKCMCSGAELLFLSRRHRRLSDWISSGSDRQLEL